MNRLRRPMRTLARDLHLWLWGAGASMVEAALYASYRGQDARFHWFTHLFVGMSAALVVMILIVEGTRRPVPLPLAWVLAGHLLAMAPDLAFVAGVAHRRWMDLFVGHVSSHYVPGRNWTWYAVFLVVLGAYFVVVDSLRPGTSQRPPTS